MGKYFRYGLIGNTIIYGIPLFFIGYTCWLLNDMT
jgi:hypothetical protein